MHKEEHAACAKLNMIRFRCMNYFYTVHIIEGNLYVNYSTVVLFLILLMYY